MKQWWLIALCVLGLSGCVGYRGVIYKTASTIYPHAEQSVSFAVDSYRPPTVDNLTPTFSWEPVSKVLGLDIRYDLLIHETYQDSPLKWAIGREIYYRQGLDKPKHTLEIQLEPNHAYYWSVRVRRDEKSVSKWSRFVFLSNCTFIGSGCKNEDFPFFIFVTPAR